MKSSNRNFHKGLKETPIARLRLRLLWATVIELLSSASLHTVSFRAITVITVIKGMVTRYPIFVCFVHLSSVLRAVSRTF